MSQETNATTEADGSGHSAGMPQLKFETYPSQILWLVIALVALYLLMVKIALPRISSVLEERQDAIANDLDRAAELKRKAEEAKESYEAALSSARSKAQEIAAAAKAEMQVEVDAATAKADAEIAARTAEGEVRIAEIRAASMENIREVAVETTGAVIEAISPGAADDKAIAKAVDAQMKG
jgi:F-type H+-transporting ATPase subunit b